MIVCAWGNKGKYYDRGREVTEILKNEGLLCKMHYLAMTKKNEPMHPGERNGRINGELFRYGDDRRVEPRLLED